ncbi:MAG: HDIG domain-containing protein [Planctomycetota bacterium]|nr:HDIG domain-containing protein [Planctomycetota bacterium]
MTRSTNNPSRVSDLAGRVRAAGRDATVRSRVLRAVATPSLGFGVLVAAGFALFAAVVTMVTHSAALIAPGRVMTETRVVRTELRIPDEGLTLQLRRAARDAAPRVYVGDRPTLDAIQSSLENLPRTLASAESLSDVDPAIVEQFGLTNDVLRAVRAESVEGQTGQGWLTRVRVFMDALARRPILDRQTWQKGTLDGTNPTIRLSMLGREAVVVPRGEALNIEDREAVENSVRVIARDAGFPAAVRPAIIARVVRTGRPTYAYDESASLAAQDAAEARAPEEFRVIREGEVIYRRGDVLTAAQATLHALEMDAFERTRPALFRWVRRGAVLGVCIAVTLALSGYTLLFCPRVRRNAQRIAGVAGILGGAFLTACLVTAWAPEWRAVSALAPTVLVAMLITIGYDRRAALAFALLHGLLVCVALRESIGMYGVIVAGAGAVVWSLKEIRDRNSLFRTTLVTALSVSLGTALFGLVERPYGMPAVREIALDSLFAAGAALGVGGTTLFLLPLIERAFNVTTGMTLAELRDPKQPLLRELAQRAPGTYTHSLNVAAIAEAAAERVGADSLLTYVGALYHDIGKMSKPEYFVENQGGGPNRHDRLSPAMSLLIVVSHVKDGIELAREFRLPSHLQHFIEAHHGTTLVEFFYHRARSQALATAPRDKDGRPIEDDTYVPDELEYRYPGPKPRTKEVAILMIADAVESASRAMSEPSPAKIEQLVRAIAHKRLVDGQFDDCELTLRELNLIVESVIRTLTSMHHVRVAYPEPSTRAPEPGAEPQTQALPPLPESPPAARTPGPGQPSPTQPM